MSPFFYDFGNDPLWNTLVRFGFNEIVIFIIIWFICVRFSKRAELMFPFFLMGTMIFLICALLKTVQVEIGIAFSLFAVFSILRFRTKDLTIKAMVYLFSIVGISAINALSAFQHIVRGPLLINFIVIITILSLEIFSQKNSFISYVLVYNQIDLLGPDKFNELVSDISKKTGKKVEKITIKKVDLVKGTAELEIFFRERKLNNTNIVK